MLNHQIQTHQQLQQLPLQLNSFDPIFNQLRKSITKSKIESFPTVASNPAMPAYLNRMKNATTANSRPASDLRQNTRHRSTPDDHNYVSYDRPPRLVLFLLNNLWSLLNIKESFDHLVNWLEQYPNKDRVTVRWPQPDCNYPLKQNRHRPAPAPRHRSQGSSGSGTQHHHQRHVEPKPMTRLANLLLNNQDTMPIASSTTSSSGRGNYRDVSLVNCQFINNLWIPYSLPISHNYSDNTRV